MQMRRTLVGGRCSATATGRGWHGSRRPGQRHVEFLKERFEGYQVEVGMHTGEEFCGWGTECGGGRCGGVAAVVTRCCTGKGDNMAIWKNMRRRVRALLVGVLGFSVGAIGAGG